METLQRKSSLDNLDYALIIEPITAGGPWFPYWFYGSRMSQSLDCTDWWQREGEVPKEKLPLPNVRKDSGKTKTKPPFYFLTWKTVYSLQLLLQKSPSPISKTSSQAEAECTR
jgi:hypothetical protein